MWARISSISSLGTTFSWMTADLARVYQNLKYWCLCYTHSWNVNASNLKKFGISALDQNYWRSSSYLLIEIFPTYCYYSYRLSYSNQPSTDLLANCQDMPPRNQEGGSLKFSNWKSTKFRIWSWDSEPSGKSHSDSWFRRWGKSRLLRVLWVLRLLHSHPWQMFNYVHAVACTFNWCRRFLHERKRDCELIFRLSPIANILSLRSSLGSYSLIFWPASIRVFQIPLILYSYLLLLQISGLWSPSW
jgi:hypothetical protein